MKVLILLIFFSTLAFSQNSKNSKLNSFFKDKTKIKNPFDLRDPFKPPRSSKKREAARKKRKEGKYSNIVEKPLESLQIENLSVQGVIIGKERRAMVYPEKGNKEQVIILKEGMKIGAEGSEVKAILPGGVILVEKITNVYGEEEYLETVIPISE